MAGRSGPAALPAPVLVADVGGTNTRLALFEDGAARDLERFRNDRFATFDAVLAAYLAGRERPALNGCCVAVAGPVSASRARLTNRDWEIDAARIAATLAPGLAGPVRLVNDLAALGHALPMLGPGQLAEIAPGAGGAGTSDQALVAGLGTGFNVALVAAGGAAPVVVAAELGHASLPHSVHAALEARCGAEAARQFGEIEDLFAGPGLARLHRVLSGGQQRSGPEILAGYGQGGCAASTASIDLLAHLLGIFTRELVFQYLPFGGIHFAGGAARGILGSAARAQFLTAFAAPGPFAALLARAPLRLITDDAAALAGAARIAGLPLADQ